MRHLGDLHTGGMDIQTDQQTNLQTNWRMELLIEMSLSQYRQLSTLHTRFLDASSHHYKKLRPSVHRSVHPLICLLVRLSIDPSGAFFWAAAPKGTKSCRTRGESVRLSIRPSILSAFLLSRMPCYSNFHWIPWENDKRQYMDNGALALTV